MLYSLSEEELIRICKRGWADCWAAMLRRCYNPKDASYVNYGGRGISVCDRWRGSLDAYIGDIVNKLGLPANDDVHLDRADNNGNYCVDNVRWATPLENVRNRRNTRTITTADGVFDLFTFAEKYSLNYNLVTTRYRQGRRTLAEFRRPKVRENRRVWLDHEGKKLSVKELSRVLGVPVSTIYNRHVGSTFIKPREPRKIDTPYGKLKLSELAAKTGVNATTLSGRIENGWPMSRICAPAWEGNSYTINGETMTIGAWCKRLGIKSATVYWRIIYGKLDPITALTKPIDTSHCRKS